MKPQKYCKDCLKNKLFCDHCFAASHRKKQGHTTVPIQEHLASALAHAAGGEVSAGAPTPMCRIHIDHLLQIFCNTCNKLVCAMCGLLEHSKHDLTPVEQAAGAHRETIESLLAEVVATRQKAIVATNAVKIIRAGRQQEGGAANSRGRLRPAAACNQAAPGRAEGAYYQCIQREGRHAEQADRCA